MSEMRFSGKRKGARGGKGQLNVETGQAHPSTAAQAQPEASQAKEEGAEPPQARTRLGCGRALPYAKWGQLRLAVRSLRGGWQCGVRSGNIPPGCPLHAPI